MTLTLELVLLVLPPVASKSNFIIFPSSSIHLSIVDYSSSRIQPLTVLFLSSVMKLQIRVGEDGVISEVKFKTFGCGSAIASSSYMTERVKGMTLDQAGAVKNTEIAKELCLPPVKCESSILLPSILSSQKRYVFSAFRPSTSFGFLGLGLGSFKCVGFADGEFFSALLSPCGRCYQICHQGLPDQASSATCICQCCQRYSCLFIVSASTGYCVNL